MAAFIARFVANPRPAAVYNIGGGRENSCSILEAFDLVAGITGRPMLWDYCETARIGDHVCYYSDLRRITCDYPDWRVSISLQETLEQIVRARQERAAV